MRFMVLPCDGIGPEIAAETVKVLQAADHRFRLGFELFEEESGFASLQCHGTTLREEVLDRARSPECDGVILGPQSNMDYPPANQGGRNVSAAFRIGLDLYANVRPARSRDFLDSPAPGMDLVVMREATEGFYPDRNMHKGFGEFMPTPDVALSVRKITAHGSERIAREAFNMARQRSRKVTAVHKANCFVMTDGLFLEQCRKVAQEYPDVAYDEKIVDAFAALLIRHPQEFDLVLCTNFHGDILSDLASELSGSLGLAGSINANAETGRVCAQAQHGSAPDIRGRNVANPTSLILSGAMMLSWLGERRGNDKLVEAGRTIGDAVDAVLSSADSRTRDLGGSMNTDDFGSCVASEVLSGKADP